MKIGFIATVYNEENTIREFLRSLFVQTKLPDEIVIVDGGSSDSTIEIIQEEFADFKKFHKKTDVKVLQKNGNRSVGRNFAIEHCSSEIICCSDAGCTLHKSWLTEITFPFQNPSVDVVAGYYRASATTVFQKSLAPYVLVMPDAIDPKTFLPATRSMAFRKKIWETIGKFDEKLSHNEDYEFARRLKKHHVRIEFASKAVIYWFPRKNLKDSFWMFFRFAYGDAEARIFRPKVLLISLRYLIVFIILDFFITFHRFIFLEMIFIAFIFYSSWAVWKNYRYVKNIRALYYLPLLQFISDGAVLLGTCAGFLHTILP